MEGRRVDVLNWCGVVCVWWKSLDGLDCPIPPCRGSQIDPEPQEGTTRPATSLCHCFAKMGGVFGPAFRDGLGNWAREPGGG